MTTYQILGYLCLLVFVVAGGWCLYREGRLRGYIEGMDAARKHIEQLMPYKGK